MEYFYHDPTTQFKPPATTDPSGLNTGFKHYKLMEGEKYHSEYENYNQLFFLLKGRLVIYSSETLGKVVNAGELFFLPISAVMSCETLSPCNFIVFFFDQLVNPCERNYVRELSPICAQNTFTFQTITIRSPLQRFIRDMLSHLKQFENNQEYQYIKYEESLYLFRTIYSREEMAALFHPIVGHSAHFRKFILENFLKVRNINELVKLSGLKRKTFDRQFYSEFEDTPYQWVLRQKSKHVRYALSETNDQMQDIMRKYGFTIPPHFTRFCKDYFHCAPMELRRRLRLEKTHTPR
jgi:AraC-like DNA-binding protein